MHIVSLALGGCLKAEPVRYGITEDTGGHITYILGEMEALSCRDDVTMAEIITRRFDEPRLGNVHAQPEEWINPKLVIRRIDSGNAVYLAKEALSADRAAFAAALIADLRSRDRLPDLIHAHFADAADVAIQIERALGIPYVYTAHSLGADKQEAMDAHSSVLKMRIEEEDRAIHSAQAIIGSSRDECERQLAAYPSTQIGKVHRLIPGIDRGFADCSLASASELISPFLRDPSKPMVLAVARPVHKKNLAGLVDAFGSSEFLRENCNLVILAGLREDLASGEAEQREVLHELVEAIDRYDLYGSIAYPKSHTRSQVRSLYALAARTRGVFVNPALMEPYGLTLVEAASHGLPVVATGVGGAQDILSELEHGLLIDPTDTCDIAQSIERLVCNRRLWSRCSENAQRNSESMDWDRYANGFLQIASEILDQDRRCEPPDRLLVSDLDNTLTGCAKGIARFDRFLDRQSSVGFVIATGRSFVEARRLIREWNLPAPHAWITSVGTEIYLNHDGGWKLDESYAAEIAAAWDPEAIDEVLGSRRDLIPQADYEQRDYKRSYFASSPQVVADVKRLLEQSSFAARVVFSHARLLDILPVRAGKAAAMKHVANVFGVPEHRVFAAGDSGNDIDMLTVCENAILVGNHANEVAALAERPNVYLAKREHASGALEGLLAQQRAQQLRIRQTQEAAA